MGCVSSEQKHGETLSSKIKRQGTINTQQNNPFDALRESKLHEDDFRQAL
jgi:hypothetical protein